MFLHVLAWFPRAPAELGLEDRVDDLDKSFIEQATVSLDKVVTALRTLRLPQPTVDAVMSMVHSKCGTAPTDVKVAFVPAAAAASVASLTAATPAEEVALAKFTQLAANAHRGAASAAEVASVLDQITTGSPSSTIVLGGLACLSSVFDAPASASLLSDAHAPRILGVIKAWPTDVSVRVAAANLLAQLLLAKAGIDTVNASEAATACLAALAVSSDVPVIARLSAALVQLSPDCELNKLAASVPGCMAALPTLWRRVEVDAPALGSLFAVIAVLLIDEVVQVDLLQADILRAVVQAVSRFPTADVLASACDICACISSAEVARPVLVSTFVPMLLRALQTQAANAKVLTSGFGLIKQLSGAPGISAPLCNEQVLAMVYDGIDRHAEDDALVGDACAVLVIASTQPGFIPITLAVGGLATLRDATLSQAGSLRVVRTALSLLSLISSDATAASRMVSNGTLQHALALLFSSSAAPSIESESATLVSRIVAHSALIPAAITLGCAAGVAEVAAKSQNATACEHACRTLYALASGGSADAIVKGSAAAIAGALSRHRTPKVRLC